MTPENTAAQQEQEVEQEELENEVTSDSTVEGPEEGEATGTTEQEPFAEFGGEEAQVEKRQRDAHRATIQSVTAETSDKGSHEIKVQFLSDDTGSEIRQDIWVPATFAENTGKFLTKQLGIEDLPPGTPDPERPGKLKGNQRAHYGMSIKNSAGDASVQVLLSAASKSGRTAGPLAKAFNAETTFEEYCAALNEVLAGLQVIVTRRVEATDDNPRGFLRVNMIYPTSILEDPKAMKALAKYVKHWTVGQE